MYVVCMCVCVFMHACVCVLCVFDRNMYMCVNEMAGGQFQMLFWIIHTIVVSAYYFALGFVILQTVSLA